MFVLLFVGKNLCTTLPVLFFMDKNLCTTPAACCDPDCAPSVPRLSPLLRPVRAGRGFRSCVGRVLIQPKRVGAAVNPTQKRVGQLLIQSQIVLGSCEFHPNVWGSCYSHPKRVGRLLIQKRKGHLDRKGFWGAYAKMCLGRNGLFWCLFKNGVSIGTGLFGAFLKGCLAKNLFLAHI